MTPGTVGVAGVAATTWPIAARRCRWTIWEVLRTPLRRNRPRTFPVWRVAVAAVLAVAALRLAAGAVSAPGTRWALDGPVIHVVGALIGTGLLGVLTKVRWAVALTAAAAAALEAVQPAFGRDSSVADLLWGLTGVALFAVAASLTAGAAALLQRH